MSYFNNARFDLYEWRNTNTPAGFGGHRKTVGSLVLEGLWGNLTDLSTTPDPMVELTVDEPNSSTWRMVVSGRNALRMNAFPRLEGMIIVVKTMRTLRGDYRAVAVEDISRFKISEAQVAIYADPSLHLTLVPVKEKA